MNRVARGLVAALAAVWVASCGAPYAAPPPATRVYALVGSADGGGSAGIQGYEVDGLTGALKALERLRSDYWTTSIAAPAEGGRLYASTCVKWCVLTEFAIESDGRLAARANPTYASEHVTRIRAAGVSVASKWDNSGTAHDDGIDLFRRDAVTGALRLAGRAQNQSSYSRRPLVFMGVYNLSPDGTRAYLTRSDGRLETFALAGGEFTPIAANADYGEHASDVLVTPDGAYLNVLAYSADAPHIATYRLDERGIPAFVSSVTARAGAFALAQTLDGRFLFLVTATTIDTYAFDAGRGGVVFRSSVPFERTVQPSDDPENARVGRPGEVALDASGRFLYVSRRDDQDVFVYRVDPAHGALQPIASQGPGGLAIVSVPVSAPPQ